MPIPPRKVLNADAGDADHVGGNDWDDLADYLNGVDMTGPVIIDTTTRFLNDSLRVRNPLNTFSYVHIGGAITGTRNVNYPVLTTTDSFFVFDTFPNLFTTEQKITRSSSADFLVLYKTSSSVGTGTDVKFSANSSGGIEQTYGRVRTSIVSNGLGTQNGKVSIFATTTGTDTEIATFEGTKITNNKPVQNESYIDLKQMSDASVTSPSSGYVRLFLSSTDGHLKYKRSNGDLVVVD